MADVEVEKPRGRRWTIDRHLTVVSYAVAAPPRPCADREAVAEGRRNGSRGFQIEGNGTCLARPARSANNDPCTDIIHSPREVQHV